MIQQNENIQLTMKVFSKRRSIFLKYTPKEEFEQILQGKSIQQVEQAINKFYGKSTDVIQLMTDYFIKFSRIWEVYSLDSNNRQRFKKFNLMAIHFNRSYHFFSIAINNLQKIEYFQDKKLLEQVKQNIKLNIKVVQFIVQSELSENDIDQYFKDQHFYLYRGEFAYCLLGLSSYDGKRIYISELIQNSYSYKSINIQIIEALIMDNIYFWKIKNNNPFLIMSDINQKMVDQNGDQIEAGDHYLQQVYDTTIWQPNPFRMSTSDVRFLK